MIDLEELKVKHAESDKSASKYLECAGMLMRAFPAIVAKLEAAQRLRDAVGIPDTQGGSYQYGQKIAAAIAAFDKEQQ